LVGGVNKSHPSNRVGPTPPTKPERFNPALGKTHPNFNRFVNNRGHDFIFSKVNPKVKRQNCFEKLTTCDIIAFMKDFKQKKKKKKKGPRETYGYRTSDKFKKEAMRKQGTMGARPRAALTGGGHR
jgi:hypothetical protein